MTGLVTREKENDVKTRGNANGGGSLQPVFGNEQRFAYSLQSPFKKGPAPETGLSSSGWETKLNFIPIFVEFRRFICVRKMGIQVKTWEKNIVDAFNRAFENTFCIL